MKKFMYTVMAFGVVGLVLSSQGSTVHSELEISNTKDRIWAAAQSKNG